jgi:hypothetical protein
MKGIQVSSFAFARTHSVLSGTLKESKFKAKLVFAPDLFLSPFKFPADFRNYTS